MIAFKPSAKIETLAVRDRMSRATQDRITTDTLEEYDMELRDLYHDLYVSRTSMPALCNTDGDSLSFHTLKYTISSPRKVFDALKELTGGFASEEGLLEEAKFDSKGDLRKVEIPWLVEANAKHAGMENTVHGRIIIDGKKMTCEVNSAERAERLRAIIEKKLPGGDAAYKTMVVQSAEAMMRESTSSASEDAEHEALMNHTEVHAHIEKMMSKHWEAWPDIELPALRGKTPRQAVRNKLGRQQVTALLEEAERNCRSKDGTLGSLENLQRARRELGLETS